VGFELGISKITVTAHRGQVMRKMKAGSLADLVNMGGKARQNALAIATRKARSIGPPFNGRPIAKIATCRC
jgi:DNA-binding NarL/FixJ family response regulator